MIKNIHDMKQLKHNITLLLGHRRKKIRNCLTQDMIMKSPKRQRLNISPDNVITQLAPLGIDSDARGETLSPSAFVALANLIAAK